MGFSIYLRVRDPLIVSPFLHFWLHLYVNTKLNYQGDSFFPASALMMGFLKWQIPPPPPPTPQRSACWPKGGAQQVFVPTRTADSSRSPSTTSTRCWRSTPWCVAPSRPSPSTGWTASVSPVLHRSTSVPRPIGRLFLPVIVPCRLVFTSICLPPFFFFLFLSSCLVSHHWKHLVSAILCCMTCMQTFFFITFNLTFCLLVVDNIWREIGCDQH